MELRSARTYAEKAPISSVPSRAEQRTYASGGIASNFVWNMAGGLLLFYYTDVLLLTFAVPGIVVLAFRILDAVFDPVFGILVELTRSRRTQACGRSTLRQGDAGRDKRAIRYARHAVGASNSRY